jgi:hypothetical protein
MSSFGCFEFSLRGGRREARGARRGEHEPRARATVTTRLTSRASWLLLLLLALATLGAVPAKKPKVQKIAVTTQLDRTAVWVGDTFRYTVRAIHDPDVEIVLESLKKEGMNLAPFVVRDVSVRQSPFGAGKKVTEVILQLTTYESGQSDLRIPSFVLYYFMRKAGSQKGEDTLAESLPVPATKIGLRSTLAGDALRPRDARVVAQDNAPRWMVALALGSAGILLVGFQTARRLWVSVTPEKAPTRHLTRRGRLRMLRDFLRSVRTMGRDSAEDQLRYYAAVSSFVRSYLSEWLGVEVASMTPDEVTEVLARRGRGGLGPPVKSLLDKCEQVLYTRQGVDLAKAWRDEVQADVDKLAQRMRF